MRARSLGRVGLDQIRRSGTANVGYWLAYTTRAATHWWLCTHEDEPVEILVADLAKLNPIDIPRGVSIVPVANIDAKGVRLLQVSCTLLRRDKSTLVAEVEEHGLRKYWSDALCVGYYDTS
jgi:hypothetical protein